MKKVMLVAVLAVLVSLVSYAQPGGGMRRGEGGEQMKRLSIQERLEILEEKLIEPLSLTEDQAIEVRVAFRDFYEGADAMMKAMENGERPSREKMDLLAQTRDTKIKAHLTPEQYTNYLELEKELRPQRPGQGQMPR